MGDSQASLFAQRCFTPGSAKVTFGTGSSLLLNIGSEDMKGTDEIREAAALLRTAAKLDMDFKGFIEGDRLSRGDVDVVVCDGFSGNIALKTAEGTARFVADLLKLLLKIRSRESDVAAKLLARGDELDLLAAGKRDGLSILEGWRFEEFGRDALDLVEGRLAFAILNGKLKMTRTEKLAETDDALPNTLTNAGLGDAGVDDGVLSGGG